MNTNNKNGYYHGKYYIDGKEVELPDDIKEIFEEASFPSPRLPPFPSKLFILGLVVAVIWQLSAL